MSHEAFVGLFFFLGAVTGAMSGWVSGKIVYDLDKGGNSYKYFSLLCGVAVAEIICVATPEHFHWIAPIAFYPVVLICNKVADELVAPAEADNWEPWRTPEQRAASNQRFYQIWGLGASVLVTASVSVQAYLHFGTLGGVVACTLGAPILTIPATGLVFLLFVLTVILVEGTPRLPKALTRLGAAIGSYLTQHKAK